MEDILGCGEYLGVWGISWDVGGILVCEISCGVGVTYGVGYIKLWGISWV